MDVKIEKSWSIVLKDELNAPYFTQLVSFLQKEYNHKTIFPDQSQIFRALNECPFDKVKVVILGQDPYHTKSMANGLCFSVPSEVKKLPPSLKNIFKELQSDIGGDLRLSGDLSSWAEQGVLLLNTVLTVEEGKADSHAGKGWETFTDAVLRALNHSKQHVVYVLWGSKAILKAAFLNQEKNAVLKAPHPSPLSSYRGFFDSKPFSKTNDYLKSKSITEISW